MSTRRFLLLPHLKIHNANALSSPFTIGFPAMSAWLGFVHALQRKLIDSGYTSLELIATAVISHQCDLQTYKGQDDFVHSIIGTGNPLDKGGNRSAFIEEARCHLDVSLLIEYQANGTTEEALRLPEFLAKVSQHLMRMKVAGGDLQQFGSPTLQVLDDSDEQAQGKLMRSLMPGFALLERRELMQQAMEQGADALDAMLEYLTVHHHCTQDDDGNVSWKSLRKMDSNNNKTGWVVPIAVGFQGISELGKAKNQRDSVTPHRFAESVVTLGEFRMAHKIQNLDEVLWHYHTDAGNDLYLCQQIKIEDVESENDGFY